MKSGATLRLRSRIYSALLFLYPRTLRRQFGEEMTEVFTDQLRDARQCGGWCGEVRVWGCVAGETVRTATWRFWEYPWCPP